MGLPLLLRLLPLLLLRLLPLLLPLLRLPLLLLLRLPLLLRDAPVSPAPLLRAAPSSSSTPCCTCIHERDKGAAGGRSIC